MDYIIIKIVIKFQTKPEGGLAVFYESPKSTDKTVITNAQRIKGLIEKSKEGFFTNQNAKPPVINSGNGIGLGDNSLNYDDDYYSDEEPAELDANFVGKDYSDEDEFYDYEEYDSIVNVKRRAFQNQYRSKQLIQKPEQRSINLSDDDYNYEYYEDDNGLSITKAYNSHPVSSKLDPDINENIVNGQQQTSIQRRHSFSSIDRDNEDYEKRTKQYFEDEGYESDRHESVGQYLKSYSAMDPQDNYHITYDGKYKYSPKKEEKEAVPNYNPSVSSNGYLINSNHPSRNDFSQRGKLVNINNKHVALLKFFNKTSYC